MRSKVIDQRRQAGYFPYYKVQWWDKRTVAWRDVQRRFATPQNALDHGRKQHPRVEVRVMTVSRTGRQPYQF